MKKIGFDFITDAVEMTVNLVECFGGIKEYKPALLLPIEFQFTFPMHYTHEAILYYLDRKYHDSLEKLEASEPRADEMMGFPIFYERIFYQCLILIRSFLKDRNEDVLTKINSMLEEYKQLSELSPKYFLPKYQILKAYFMTTSDKIDHIQILKEFDVCIKSCEKNSLIMNAGIAIELVLEFVSNDKYPEYICLTHYNHAMSIWEGIGAKLMINNLKKDYPILAVKRSSKASNTTYTRTINQTISTESTNIYSTVMDSSLDMLSIVKMTQALSVELNVSTLMKKVMEIILENIGAERGILLMFKKGELFVNAIAENSKVTLVDQKSIDAKDLFCHTLIDVVSASKKDIILENALDSSFAQNFYIATNKSKSIFVHPITKGNTLIGIIYLENNSIEGTFDSSRKFILGHISSQLAISYENATLYDQVTILNKSYERFLPKEFLNQLGKGDVTKIKKGDAVTKKMSVLFADIRGFTNLTEKMNSEESFSFVNDILSHLAPAISKNHGFIDKFLGDCIMALFPYQVDDAIRCGLEMIEKLKIFNKTSKIQVKFGIGINYGDVMIGTLGAEERLDGTVISDTVNTASRVESLTKTLGATFVVTKQVMDNLSHTYNNRFIGNFLLKGKDIPMTLYQIIDADLEVDIDNFNIAMKEFKSQKFSIAKELFKKLKDQSSQYLMKVSEMYEDIVFEDKWEGEIKIDKDGNPELLSNNKFDKSIELLTIEEKQKLFDELIVGKSEDILKLISKKYSKEIQKILNKD